MPELTSSSLNYINLSQVPRKGRYLSFNPRTDLFNAEITDFVLSEYGSVLGIVYDNEFGDDGDLYEGMTVDFSSDGTATDKGRGRFRSIDTDNNIIYIGEISYSEIPFDLGDFIIVREEFLIWHKKPRIVKLKTDGSLFYNDFTEYHDYDVAYTDENENIAPKANITLNGNKTQARPAGFADGITFRTVTLDSSTSDPIDQTQTIVARTWNVMDGTITVGNANSTAIVVTFPASRTFRYISLNVESSNGKTDTLWFPIWVHDDDHPPLSPARITSDDRSEGRSMSFQFSEGQGLIFSDDVIPKETLFCFWQDFNAPQYIDQFLGWNTEETTLLKLKRDQYTLSIEGAQYFLNKLDGFAQRINRDSSESKWYNMPSPTLNKIIAYVLREYTTAFNVCNFYTSAINDETPGEDIRQATIWQQILELQGGNQMGTCNCDSLGSIFLRQYPSYMSDSDLNNIDVLLDLDPSHWNYEQGLSVQIAREQKVGMVKATGDAIQSNEIVIYASRAPAKIAGQAPGVEEMPYQRLPSTNPQTVLNRLTGHHWARVNNTHGEVTLTMRGDIDFVEIAWGEIVTITYTHPNLRFLSLDHERFLVKRISVSYANEYSQKPKQITWTLEKITRGLQGFTETLERRPDAAPSPNKAIVDDNGYLLITENFDNPEPIWSRTDLEIEGTALHFRPNPFSDAYLSAGEQVDALLVTSTHIYTVEDVYGTPIVTERFEFRKEETLRSVDISKGFPTNAAVVTSYDDGCYRTWTDDLENWETEEQFGSGSAQQVGGGGDAWDFNVASYSSEWDNDTDSVGSWGISDNTGSTNVFKSSGTVVNTPSLGNRTLLRIVPLSSITLTQMNITFDFFASSNIQTRSGNWYVYHPSGGATDGNGEKYSNMSFVNTGSGVTGTPDWSSLSDNAWHNIVRQWIGSISGVTKIVLNMRTTDFSGFPNTTGRFEIKTFAINGATPGTGEPWLNQSPGCFVSSIEDGRLYTSGAIDSGTDTDGFESVDNGDNMSQISVPNILPGENLCGDIGVLIAGNFDEETTLYHGAIESGERKTKKVLFTGTTFADISPTYDMETYGPFKDLQVRAHPQDGNIMFLIGANADKSLVGLWVSADGGITLYQQIEPIADNPIGRTEQAMFVGKGTLQMYIWGTNGFIGFSPDLCNTLEDKRGNIPDDFPDTGVIVGLVERYA